MSYSTQRRAATQHITYQVARDSSRSHRGLQQPSAPRGSAMKEAPLGLRIPLETRAVMHWRAGIIGR